MYNSVPYSTVQVFRLKCCSQLGGEAQQLAIRLVPMGGLFFCFGSGSGQPSIKRRLPQQKRIIFSQPSLFTRELVVIELAAASPKKPRPKNFATFSNLSNFLTITTTTTTPSPFLFTMVIITAKQQQKLDAKKQLTSVGKIAQMTVAQSFMFFFLNDRVQRVSVLETLFR